MRFNQKLTEGAYEVALFPMEYLRITQGRYSNFSHKGYNAYDLAGKDGGIDPLYAPFTLKTEWVDNGKHKTGAVFSNAKPIIMANGKTLGARQIMMMLWHDNNIKHLKVGKIIEQGKPFYNEGTAGMATGNHVHLELSYGVYAGGYPLFRLSNGYYTLKGLELDIEDCFYVNDTKVLDTLGYKFKSYTKPPISTTEPATSIKHRVGDEVMFSQIANKANNGRLVSAYYPKGTIERIFEGAQYPYRIKRGTSIIGFVNDDLIKGEPTLSKPTINPGAPTSKPKTKWLRIPTTITEYSYYRPNQRNKTVSNRWSALRPALYANQAKFIEYRVVAERGDFKTIQLHGDPANPKIDIFTGKGTEHAWEIFCK